MPDERFAIAQVTPYAWEQHHEVNRFVERVSDELCGRGHRVVVVAPSDSRGLIRDSRRLVRGLADDPDAVFAADGCAQVVAVGQSIPFPPARRAAAVSLPVDVSRTIQQLLESAAFDFVHVHEPFAPSASSTALRHSRSLNIGTFHAATERVISTQVARRIVALLFGRLDGRTASFAATRELVSRHFPGDYRLVPPGADVVERDGESGGAVEILFAMEEERSALRLFLRALRRLPADLPWRATVWSRQPYFEPSAPLGRALRERVRFRSSADGSEAQHLAAADVLVAASAGSGAAPQLVLGALAGGAVPVVSRVRVYEDALSDGELGLLFEPRDAAMLASQLERLIRDERLRRGLRDAARARRAELTWARTADGIERLYREVAARRHSAEGRPEIRRRLARRGFIHVDLHMHTDHSHDCATRVETLIETAARRGLDAIAVTDHNEVSGALEARERANGRVKVIVGEEVKTADQGEVIGLFIEEKIPRGMTLQETIAEIRRQGGLVYVPHPFDRMHAVPDYEYLLEVVEDIDAIEVFNPRVAFSAFNEEAARFAAKYRIPAGAGSDSHVVQGLGSVKIRMRDFEGPEEFLESLRDADIVRKRQSLVYVQALKFLQTKASPAHARRRAARRTAGTGG
ncbi:MAG: CehA/McbA family metallohydrolase [Thermoleophilaceae bacterium]|nr:CehA/McbA family metallohydrolase [Thermoleophilaceae bacterium]